MHSLRACLNSTLGAPRPHQEALQFTTFLHEKKAQCLPWSLICRLKHSSWHGALFFFFSQTDPVPTHAGSFMQKPEILADLAPKQARLLPSAFWRNFPVAYGSNVADLKILTNNSNSFFDGTISLTMTIDSFQCLYYVDIIITHCTLTTNPAARTAPV